MYGDAPTLIFKRKKDFFLRKLFLGKNSEIYVFDVWGCCFYFNFGKKIFSDENPLPHLPLEASLKFPLSLIFKLGQRAFFGAGKTRSDLYGGDITVSIGDDNIEKTLEAKAEIPWLLSAKQVDVDSTRKYIFLNFLKLTEKSVRFSNLSKGKLIFRLPENFGL